MVAIYGGTARYACYHAPLRNEDRYYNMPDGIAQAERSRRWRVGIAQRLEVIQAELRELGDQISRELAVVTDKLAEQERRAGRQQ
jgi:hypothetical protein